MPINHQLAAAARRLLTSNSGVSSIEFGLILGLVALGAVQAMSSLGDEVRTDFDQSKQEVAANRANADPFGRGPGGESGNSGSGVNSGSSDGGAPEPAAAPPVPAPQVIDGGSTSETAPEVAPASVAPDWYN